MTKEIDIENWASQLGHPPLPAASEYRIRLWSGDSFDEKRSIADPKPLPEQILKAFGLRPARDYILLIKDRHGVSELALGETIDISDRRAERFFAFKTDRTYKVELNGDRFTWGAPTISAILLRIIGRIPEGHQLLLARKDKPDLVLGNDAEVNLAAEDLEIICSREASWKLKVQGVVLTLTTSKISVRDALIKAGIDPDKGWTAALKIKGAPREAIGLESIIDLSRQGIEKLWLRPNHINNGEAPCGLRRDFDLTDSDTTYLRNRGLHWDSLIEGASRWIILRDFPLPDGYTAQSTNIAVQIPATYPQAALDMFYCHPFAQLKSGQQIPRTEARQSIAGQSYQRWSRHRSGSTAWNPNRDSLITHIAIIDDALEREVE